MKALMIFINIGTIYSNNDNSENERILMLLNEMFNHTSIKQLCVISENE
jgi:hypothetical protein